jgi:hypothetical protein
VDTRARGLSALPQGHRPAMTLPWARRAPHACRLHGAGHNGRLNGRDAIFLQIWVLLLSPTNTPAVRALICLSLGLVG